MTGIRLPAALPSLLVGAVLISFSGVWVKAAHVAPTTSAFYRVFFGGTVLLILAGRRGELRLPEIRHWVLGFLCGLMFALDLVCYHYSIGYIGPGLGTILPNFQVFILGGAGILFLGERVRPIYFLSVPMAFAGLLMIVGMDWDALGPTYRKGVSFGFAAAACYAGYLLSIRKFQAEQPGASRFYVVAVVTFTTTLLLAAEVLRTGDGFRIPDLQSLLALLALGLFSQVLGWILIANALPKLRASLSGLILLLQPALAFVWDVLFFERPTTLVNWLGVAVALAAIYLGTAWKTPK
jgi:drug/metabolite transporter (DMT)-like permease